MATTTTASHSSLALDVAVWSQVKKHFRNPATSGADAQAARSDAVTTSHLGVVLPTCLTPREVAEAMRYADRVHGCTGRVESEQVVARYATMRQDREQLISLLRSPGVKQRTPEWYRARHEVITASDIAQALGKGKFGTKRQFVEKKLVDPVAAGPPSSTSPTPIPTSNNISATTAASPPTPSVFDTLPPLKWGSMFEDVAASIYCARMDTRLNEFGLILHSDPSVRLGASPDGITDNGVMVEIKCPYKRRITGEVPLQYYMQIQGQLLVCGLRHCDYLECEFSEYRNAQEFEVDILEAEDGCAYDAEDFGFACNGREKGVIAEYASDEGSPYYKYSPLCPSFQTYRSWMRDRSDADLDADRSRFRKFHFWRLEVLSIVRVDRDDFSAPTLLKDLDAIWSQVKECRRDATALDRVFPSSSHISTAAPATLTPASASAPLRPLPLPHAHQAPFDRTSNNEPGGTVQLGGYAFLDDDANSEKYP